MTKFKTTTRSSCVVFETGSPNHNNIYIDGDAYDITTLAQKFDSPPLLSTSNALPGMFGDAANAGESIYNSGAQTNTVTGSQPYNSLALSKYTAYAQQRANTGNAATNAMVPHNFIDMDPDGQHGSVFRFTNSDGDERIIWNKSSFPYNWYYISSWHNTGSTEITDKRPDYYTGSTGSTANNGYRDAPIRPVAVDASGEWIAYIASYGSWAEAQMDRPMWSPGRADMNNHGNVSYSVNRSDNYHIQHIGKSATTNDPILLYNYRHHDYAQIMKKYDVSANTLTTLHTFNTAPAAGGTSYGGVRGTTTIGDVPKYASQTFTDFTSGADAADKGFYVPYFDTNYDYHPHYYQWDTSADTFTRNTDITISGDKSSVHFASISGAPGDNTGHRVVIYNDTHVSNGTRYLSLYAFSGQQTIHDGANTSRTIVTYSCGASDPKTLTHHSTTIVPFTPMNICYVKDDKSVMAIMTKGALYFYTWDDTNGWELTQTVAGRFHAIGRDKTDRIWAVEQSTSGWYMDAHVLSLDVPVKVTVTPASSSYNYTGSTINSSVAVSAFNISNERVAKDIKLTIDGTSMQFDSDGSGNANSDSATVTTLTNADISKPIKIVSSGLSEIIANINL